MSADLEVQAPELLVPLHRHSAPNLLRSWRLRRAASAGSASVGSTPEVTRGLLGLNLLFEPSEPRLDIIFVHGLQGGSRKTWSLDPTDPLTYWPREWLPLEPGFRHARIHSFGYDSDWRKSAVSTLTVHDFALALLADLKHSQAFKRNGNTPIVFVAHSMGGLVIKKAFLLATRNETYKDISSRIHTMYFLGTPHRGSDSAAYLKAYLSLPLPTGAKSFVKELMPDSQTVHDINYEFRYACSKLKLFSFFESQPTAGVMIVEKQSAVIGLPNEEEQYLPVDHRHLCKFESDQDPGYLIIMRKLKTTVEDILKDYESQYREEYHSQMNIISKAFDNALRPCNDLYATQTPSKYHSGSCQWLTDDAMFSRWLSPDPDGDEVDPLATPQASSDSRFLWLYGPPGSGKSIASGHTINFLDSNNFDVSYYFFKAGMNSTVAMLLLSLAYQMAEANLETRQSFLAMIKDGSIINSHDYTMIWNTLFLGCILKTQFRQPQYWVIDALDECPRDSLVSLVQMLARVNPNIPLKIFLSSRPESRIQQIFEHENIRYIKFQTGQGESLRDIGAYLLSWPKLREEGDSQPLVDLILQKSDGIFLWAALIMDRLEDCYSIEDMESVVKGVPSEMNDFYADIVDKIEQSTNADLAKCILKWIVSAPEPLSVDELREAVKLDIKRTLLASGSHIALSQICRNLVLVNEDGHVQLMHQTVKTYITSKDSNFYISKRQAHEDIALICLTYLNGPDFQPRNSRRTQSSNVTSAAFDRYTIRNFAYHLEHARSLSRSTFADLQTFMNTKAPVWVERIAETGKLSPMIRAIKSLKQYLARLLDTNHPLDNSLQELGAWTNDLTRLVTNFGINIVDSPSSIYTSIPSLCPSSSMIHKYHTGRLRQKVICPSNKSWDERSSCIPLQSDAKSVATSSKYVAVGLVKGQVRIYDHSTLELVDELHHGGPVRQLTFGNISGVLVSGSPRLITMWSADRTKLWTSAITGILFSVCFSPDDSLVFATVKGEIDKLIMAFDTQDGTTVGYMQIDNDTADSDSDDNTKSRARYIPEVVKMSPLLGLAAVSYRSTHLTLYSTDFRFNRMSRIGRFAKEGSEDSALPPQVLDVAFCPATEYRSFAVLYQDGDLVTAELDHYERASQRDVYHIFARVLAVSPDGHVLAAGENSGAVSLFAFDTLQLIHRITYDSIVTGIIFAPNSLCFYDIRGRTCNVWEPPSLLRKDRFDDDSSQADESQHEPKNTVVSRISDQKKDITTIAQAGDDFFMFCGRADGSITIHNVTDGKVAMEIGEHKVSILHLTWNHKLKILYSVDIASRCIATRLTVSRAGQWNKLDQLFNHKINDRVTQVIAKQDEMAVLIATESKQILREEDTFTSYAETTDNMVWMLHPTNKDQLLLINGSMIQLYNWKGLKKVDEAPTISILTPPDIEISTSPTSQWACRIGTALFVQALNAGSEAKTALLALDTSRLQLASPKTPLIGTIYKLPCEIRTLIGVFGSKVFFLTRRGWICSYNLKSPSGAKHYSRHFFIPPFWRTGNDLMIHIVSKNHVALVYRDELVLLQRFLDLEEKIPLDGAK
ncbi:WD40 repeat-like protein [Xylaria bambusicola]|uniref:WD40 repeat-like protein n=1 Tax=Xylaria bambusicola TaxID=326684 RepID=UPI0020086860|nr:WD40 repeat-like protein [Xylaria bambusicola]KAI0523866.1 WD40 repeat-like protein [Xylaria bambusicola]